MDSAARFCLSDELHKAGQLASALEQARTAAALKPGTAWYHHHLAHLLMLSARYAEASKAIAESVELEPKRAAHHYIRGEVMLKLGDSAGAKNLCGLPRNATTRSLGISTSSAMFARSQATRRQQ